MVGPLARPTHAKAASDVGGLFGRIEDGTNPRADGYE
jgi:hypothetical protein